MTLKAEEQQLVYKDLPLFSLWDLKWGRLFGYRESDIDEGGRLVDLTSKVYILMKRLHQPYVDILRMESKERDELFRLEIQLIKQEAESKKNGS